MNQDTDALDFNDKMLRALDLLEKADPHEPSVHTDKKVASTPHTKSKARMGTAEKAGS